MNTRRHGLFYIDGIAIALLLVLCLAFFRKVLLSNRIIFGIDSFTYFYPYRAYAAEALRSGRIPLWNPFLFLGVPFLANPQTAVFYPLNLVLYWLSAPKLLAWSAAIHIAIGATFTYLYARSILRLSTIPALLASSTFAFGGLLSGQVEHINQLNVSVWFPLLLLLWEQRAKWRWKALMALGLVIGIGLLAGHAQSSYISITGLFIYALFPILIQVQDAIHVTIRPDKAFWKRGTRSLKTFRAVMIQTFNILLDLVVSLLISIAISAVQLFPSIELARLSIRSGGLSYREAVAFSLKPLPKLLRYSFLPPWGQNLNEVFGGSYYTEYLSYIGTLPLLLVLLVLLRTLFLFFSKSSLERNKPIRQRPTFFLLLAGLGIFLALGLYNPVYYLLYKVVPGIGLFRVPARWLFFYVFGASMLAGIGLEQIAKWSQQVFGTESPILQGWLQATSQLFVLLITLIELFRAALILPLSQPTAPQAFSSLRTTPAYIIAMQDQSVAAERVLSMSDILFDPGDLAEIQAIFQDQLSTQELYDYIISNKYKEIIAPNLPLTWKIYAADGYDGGLLPLKSYVLLQHLFLSQADILTDGRLREGLSSIPSSRLLSVLNIAFVITDKVLDVWLDDVFYDLSFDTQLQSGETATIREGTLPDFTATGLGIISYLEDAHAVADGTVVAKVSIDTKRSGSFSYLLHAGQDTAEGAYSPDTLHLQARIGRKGSGESQVNDYVTMLSWKQPVDITSVSIGATPFAGSLHIRGLALVDERDKSSVPLILSNHGRFRQVHSGDTKIYQALDTLPRAFIVHKTQICSDDHTAINLIADPEFDPAVEAILSEGQALDYAPTISSKATITTYEPEFVSIQASLDAPGYLILSDTWYPGWTASIDGLPTDIIRANIHFRAIYLPVGNHIVTFEYKPKSYTIGAEISLLSLVSISFSAILCVIKRTRIPDVQ